MHTHLRSIQTDDSIYIPGTVEEVGDRDSMFAGGNPILLGVRVDLEDVGPCAEDGLLSVQWKEETRGGGGRDGTISIWLKASALRLSSLKYVVCKWTSACGEEKQDLVAPK